MVYGDPVYASPEDLKKVVRDLNLLKYTIVAMFPSEWKYSKGDDLTAWGTVTEITIVVALP